MAGRREEQKRRRAFERAMLSALRPAARGTGWKKRESSLFRGKDSLVFAAFVRIFVDEDRQSMHLEVKPMAIDPIYWAIMGMAGNERESLSLRAWGSFVCPGVSFAESTKSQLGDPEASAREMVEWAAEEAERAIVRLTSQPFSQFIREHPHHLNNGAYAETLVCALILEGRHQDAADLAEEYRDGKRSAPTSTWTNDESFFQRAARWIPERSA